MLWFRMPIWEGRRQARRDEDMERGGAEADGGRGGEGEGKGGGEQEGTGTGTSHLTPS